MRWDRFFEDLEDQLDSEWEAERAAMSTEAERLRVARILLRDRLVSLLGHVDRTLSIELTDGAIRAGRLVRVGADWIALDVDAAGASAVLVPLHAVSAIGMPHADVLSSAREATPGPALQQRMTLGFVLRDLARRRISVTVSALGGRVYSGTIDRAGADHVDLALHDAGAPRRSGSIKGHRLLLLRAILAVHAESPAAFG